MYLNSFVYLVQITWTLPPFLGVIAPEVRPSSGTRRTINLKYGIIFSPFSSSRILQLLETPRFLPTLIPLSSPRILTHMLSNTFSITV